MKASLVSIVMPFRNTARFLPECLDSILAQTDENWELLATDDYSTDHSKTILEQYAKKDKRIKVFTNNKKGIIGALQMGASKATGEFITRMDSDDVMLPAKLAKLKGNLLRYGKKHIAVGPVKYFSHESALSEGFLNYEKWLNCLTAEGKNYEDIYKECVIPSPSWMCYRDDFDLCGGFDQEDYPEDYDLTFRFCKNQLQCIPESTILHNWRDYSSRTSRTDNNYADNTFLNLKIKYFLQLHYNPEKKILLWGAGAKGKKTAKLLLEKKINFEWICENPNKVGKNIYGKILNGLERVQDWSHFQSIVTVANPLQQEKIKTLFTEHQLSNQKDFFFFC